MEEAMYEFRPPVKRVALNDGKRKTMVLGVDFRKVDHEKWKFALCRPLVIDLGWAGITGGDPGGWAYLEDGELAIKKDYHWDGSSGPSIQTKTTTMASCVHDALYQLLRDGYLGKGWKRFRLRLRADLVYGRLLRQNGATVTRSTYHFLGVAIFGGRWGVGAQGGFHGFRKEKSS